MGLCSFRLNDLPWLNDSREKTSQEYDNFTGSVLFVCFTLNDLHEREKTQEFGFLCYEDRFMTSTRSMALDLCISLSASFTQITPRKEFLITNMSVRFAIEYWQWSELIELSTAFHWVPGGALLLTMRNLNADTVSSGKFHFVSITVEHVTAKLCQFLLSKSLSFSRFLGFPPKRRSELFSLNKFLEFHQIQRLMIFRVNFAQIKLEIRFNCDCFISWFTAGFSIFLPFEIFFNFVRMKINERLRANIFSSCYHFNRLRRSETVITLNFSFISWPTSYLLFISSPAFSSLSMGFLQQCDYH